MHTEFGWGGRIRTFEYGIQSPAPYRLATPQHIRRRGAFPPSRTALRPTQSGRKPGSVSQALEADSPAGFATREGAGEQHEPVGTQQARDRATRHRLGKQAEYRRPAARHRGRQCPFSQAGPDHLADARMPLADGAFEGVADHDRAGDPPEVNRSRTGTG